VTRIAVIGVGRIGGTLGDAWRRAGHDVTFGVREPAGRDEDGRRFATPEAAVRSADVVVFAIPGKAMDTTIPELSGDLTGRTVIDATNRFDTPTAHNQALQDLASDDTPVYRAFNSLGVENFRDPRYGDEIADLFFAGPDGRARSVVESLISDVGLRPIYVGRDPDLVDSVLRLWFALTTERKSRDLAFKLLTR
jgi:predicted dinucleotide-binding enzyme